MNAHDRLVRTAFASLLALSVTVTTSPVFAEKGDQEKCAGVVKAGKNDCGTSVSACAGTSKKDNDAEAWIFVPKGTCERIAGGRLQTSADAHPGGKKG
jgi:uncharacterized membrane protein